MPPQVLVVDDDPPTREMYSIALTLRGAQVRAFGDGIGAMRLLQAGFTPDVILVDWRMPGMDGKYFCDLIAHSELLKKIPLLVVSASVAEVPGEIPSLAKPFDLKQLYTKINQTVGYLLIN